MLPRCLSPVVIDLLRIDLRGVGTPEVEDARATSIGEECDSEGFGFLALEFVVFSWRGWVGFEFIVAGGGGDELYSVFGEKLLSK